MAVRNHQQTWIQKGVSKTIWTGLLNGDTGLPQTGALLPDKSVQVSGTFGVGGSVSIKGSNDNATWFTLTDPQGNALVFTAAGMEQISENPQHMMPEVTAGDGSTSLTVTIVSEG